MSLYSIKHRFDDSVLFEMECDSLKLCVEAAVKSDANLAWASLTHADLTGADLTGANLERADLTGATLTSADLTSADLTGANLAGANLAGASLARADLTHADFEHANLTRTDLTDASLARANLARTYLAGAINIPPSTLRATRADLFDVLLRAIPEVPALLTALREGRVDGSTYEGDCACLCGTIANVRGVNVDDLDFKDATRPIESWFFAIEKGDTPATNAAAKQAEKWIVEFMELVGIADAVRAGGR